MKLTTVLLLLVAASVALAGPQRPLRRFTPRRGQEAAQVDAETAAAAEADPVEAEEPAQPRFRIAGRPSGSSFTPKRSSSPAPEPAQDAAAIIAAVAAPTPATRTPVSASPSRPRTRGSRTFVQSLKQSNIPIEASQLEKLEKSKQSLQRISSRPSSRPSTRVSTSAAPALRTPSRPSSVRAPIEKSSAATNKADQENVASKASPPASVSKPSGSDQESRRQRLLAIKKRPRAGAPSATPSVEKKNMPEEEPEQASSTPIETPKLNAMDKKDDSMPEKSTAPKLDEEVSETLDASIKSEAEQGGEAMKKQMATKETAAEEKMPKDAEPSAQSAVTPQPETSTTTVAPTAPRRINTLTRLRASRPVSGSGTGSARPRTSAPAAATPESPATDVQPRLSSRRGGRGNSRGGAALATSARVSRPSSRVPTSRVSRTGDEEAEPTQPEAPAAGTTGSIRSFRRKLPPSSRRLVQTPLNTRAKNQVEGEEGRGPRTVRHSLPPSGPVGGAPTRKQAGAEGKKTRRAGVRSLIERLRGRKTNRMRSNAAREARREEAEENVTIKEQVKVSNKLAGRQPKSDSDGREKIPSADSTTTPKPTAVIVATTLADTTVERTAARATAVTSRPRTLPPGLVKQRQASKSSSKRRRPRVERRRRPIKFATVVTSPPQPSTTAEATTLPPQPSTTAEATTLPPQPSTTAEATTLPPQSSTTAEATPLLPQSSTTVETTSLPPPSSTTTKTTTIPPQPTTTETTTLPPTSTTTQATPLAPQSSTTVQATPPPRRPLPSIESIERTTRQRVSLTTRPAPTTLVSTTTASARRTTTPSPAPPPVTVRTTPVWKPRVAPEDPVDPVNRGGFRFQPHPSSESDITRRRGEVVLTQVGILEDTPPNEVAAILRGLGGRRRGLARPPASRTTTTTQSTIRDEFSETDDYYYDY